jgi:hypothetical protein
MPSCSSSVFERRRAFVLGKGSLPISLRLFWYPSFVNSGFLLITLSSFAPVGGSENADVSVPRREADRQYPTVHFSVAEISWLLLAVDCVHFNNPMGIRKSILGALKGHSMLFQIVR